MIGGKFNIKTTRAQFLESYARDILRYNISLVEKPTNRDRRTLVADIDNPPPEIYKNGEIIGEIIGVFNVFLLERLEGVTPELIDPKRSNKGEGFFNAHVIWRTFVMDEKTARYITILATREMKRRYPEYDWNKIIDPCVCGPNGVRMKWSKKPCKEEDFRKKYPDIFEAHYGIKDGKPTKNIYWRNQKLFFEKVADWDKGEYEPDGHVGPPTAAALESRSMFVDDGTIRVSVKPTFTEDLAATVQHVPEPSRARQRMARRVERVYDGFVDAHVNTLKAFFAKAGGHEGVHLRIANEHATRGGPVRVFHFDVPAPRTCFACPERVHASNGFYVTWKSDEVTYTCFSEHCRNAPRVMDNVHAIHLCREQERQKILDALVSVDPPPGWSFETTQERWVRPLEDTLTRHKIVCVKAMMGSGKTTAVKNAILKLKPRSILILSPRRLFADSLRADMRAMGIRVDHYKSFDGVIDSYKVIVQMESLGKIVGGIVYEMLIVDESESCLKTFSSSTMDTRHVACFNTLQRCVRGAKYVIAMDAFLSPRTILAMHIMTRDDPKGLFIDYAHQPIQRRGIHINAKKMFFKIIVQKVKAGEKPYVFCGSKKVAQELVKELTKLAGKTVLFYHGEMKQATRDTMKDVVTAWKDVDVVVTTPCITVGINYDLDRIEGGWLPEHQFDCAFAYISNHSCCPRDVMQSLCRVRSYKSNDVYFTFSDSCKRDEAAVTLESVATAVETQILAAETGVEEDTPFWEENDAIRTVVGINRVEEELKLYQTIPQTLSYFGKSGILVTEGNVIVEPLEIEGAPDPHDDEGEGEEDDGDEDTTLDVPYEDIPLISHERMSQIFSMYIQGLAPPDLVLHMQKHKFQNHQCLCAWRAGDKEGKFFEEIWMNRGRKKILFKVYFHGLDADRYRRIDRIDVHKHGFTCLSDMSAKCMRIIDELLRILLGEENGPSDEKSVLLTEDIVLVYERLLAFVDHVQAHKKRIFEAFKMRNHSRKEPTDFGSKLQTANTVLEAFGFAKIVSRQVRRNKVRTREYFIACNVLGFTLREIYTVIRENKFGIDVEDAETTDTSPKKRQRA